MPKSVIKEEAFFEYLSLDNVDIIIDNDKYERYLEEVNKITESYLYEYDKIYKLSDFITFKFKDEKTSKIICFILNNTKITLTFPYLHGDSLYMSNYAKIIPTFNDQNCLEAKAKIRIKSYYNGSNVAKRLREVIPDLKSWIKSKLDNYQQELRFIYTSENVSEELGIKIKGLSIYMPPYLKFVLLMYLEDDTFETKYPMIYENLKTNFFPFDICLVPDCHKVLWQSSHKSLNACLMAHKKVFSNFKEILKNIEIMTKNFDYNYV